ncbi:hypothetical protein CIB48_g9171 [Xylaria polymorpha]|nr:hypothetical protein CIB48_g9171 [Xylaria polymorpha]
MIYSALAREPKAEYKRFITWIRLQNYVHTGTNDDGSIVLIAHFGACYNHVYLLRSMMSCGMVPPHVMFSDTLALFKTIKGINKARA